MSDMRQQVLFVWLASPALDSDVLGWAFHDGSAGAGPQPEGDPPYRTGLEALTAGWRLFQVSQLLPALPGREHDTSYMKHEFVFERLVAVEVAGPDHQLPGGV